MVGVGGVVIFFCLDVIEVLFIEFWLFYWLNIDVVLDCIVDVVVYVCDVIFGVVVYDDWMLELVWLNLELFGKLLLIIEIVYWGVLILILYGFWE